MRWFFRRRVPGLERILLVESGSREVSERLAAVVRRAWGAGTVIDLVTCYAGLPAGFPAETRVYRVADYPGRAGVRRLARELRAAGYPILGIICSGEPIMTKWKWTVAGLLPAKVFIVNENADFFWCDYSQWRTMVRFAFYRSGLAGPGAVRSAARLAVFPFTLAYLLAYAGVVHLQRAKNRLVFRH